MDPKTEYSDSVQQQKIASIDDIELAKAITEGHERKQKFYKNWQVVDINEVFKKFGILSSSKEYKKGKIVFYDELKSIAIVTDVGGGYFRIQDMSVKTNNAQYLDLNGHDAHNITVNGKTRGRSKGEYLAATHFLIKKRDNNGQ